MHTHKTIQWDRQETGMQKKSSNYHYQSKICESPFLRLNYLEPPAQMRWGEGHRFSYKWEENKISLIYNIYSTVN
jgi:hypothetical protein